MAPTLGGTNASNGRGVDNALTQLGGTNLPADPVATHREYEEGKKILFDFVDHDAAVAYRRKQAALEAERAVREAEEPSEDDVYAEAVNAIERDICAQLNIDPESDPKRYEFKATVIRKLQAVQSFQHDRRAHSTPVFNASHASLMRRIAHDTAVEMPDIPTWERAKLGPMPRPSEFVDPGGEEACFLKVDVANPVKVVTFDLYHEQPTVWARVSNPHAHVVAFGVLAAPATRYVVQPVKIVVEAGGYEDVAIFIPGATVNGDDFEDDTDAVIFTSFPVEPFEEQDATDAGSSHMLMGASVKSAKAKAAPESMVDFKLSVRFTNRQTWLVLPTTSKKPEKKKKQKKAAPPTDSMSSRVAVRNAAAIIARQSSVRIALDSQSIASTDGAETVETSTVATAQDGIQFDSHALFEQYQELGQKLHSNPALAAYISECENMHIAPLPVMDYITERDSDGHFDIGEECDLHLQQYGLGNAHAMAFGKFLGLCGLHLVVVDLENNGITTDGLTCILEALQVHPQVRKLNLSHNKFAFIQQAGSFNQEVSKAEAALVALFPENQPGGLCEIRELSLRDCYLQSGALEILYGRFASGAAPLLKRLDTSRNCMRDSAGKTVAEFIRKDTSNKLEELNISWNSIRGNQAYNISCALKDNSRLISLNIAQNHFGEEERCMVMLSEALASNSMMLYLDLSYNEIMEKGAMIFGFEALKHNYHLKHINMDGNPIGPGGGIALMAFNSNHEKDISFHHCSFELDGGGKSTFDAFKPDGHYELDLSTHIHRLMARALMELGFEHQSHAGTPCLINVTLDGRKYKPPIREFESSDAGGHNQAANVSAEDVPHKGILVFDFVSHKLKEPEQASPEIYTKLHDLVEEHAQADERRSAQVVLNATDVYAFWSVQGRELVEHLPIRVMREKAVANVLIKMKDPHNAPHVMDALNGLEQEHVKRMLGPLYLYNDENATGHYRLDLRKTEDRMVAMKLTTLNRRERAKVRKERRTDLSQHGNGEYIRNSIYNGESFLYTSIWVIPVSGTWEFDYVSPIRPPDNAHPLEHHKFIEFMKEHVDFQIEIHIDNKEELYDVFKMFDADGSGDIDKKELRSVFRSLGQTISDADLEALVSRVDSDGSGDIDIEEFLGLWSEFMHQLKLKDRLAELRHVAATVYITALQLAELIRHMGTTEERVGVFTIMYSRVVDEENFHHALSHLSEDEISYLAYHLGPISLFNPFRPSNQYKLNLERHDENLVCRMLVECNKSEPSDKTIFKMISYNEYGIPLTPWLRGDEDLPSRGRVGLLVEDNKTYNKRARAEIAMRMLGWEFEEGELEGFQ